jgi:hypothetical protein
MQQRRFTDRNPEATVSIDEARSAIRLRLNSTPPGETLQFRDEDLSIKVYEESDLTYRRILELLVDLGILRREGDSSSTYIKMSEPIDEESSQRANLIQLAYRENKRREDEPLHILDLTRIDDVAQLCLFSLQKSIKNSKREFEVIIDITVEDLTELAAILAKVIIDNLPEPPRRFNNGEHSPLFTAVEQVMIPKFRTLQLSHPVQAAQSYTDAIISLIRKLRKP